MLRWLVGRQTKLLLVTIAALLAGSALVLQHPVLPSVHDEFSYLLMADTFAEGRLSNPTPAASDHFVTFHVLLEPTYASKYPPGHGLALATGVILVGNPAWGSVFASVGAAIAIYWMLYRCGLGRAATIGATLFAFNLEMHVQWTHSFWGGQIAVIGGALVTSWLGRSPRRRTLVDWLVMGIGAGVLLISRPYEGLVLVVTAITVDLYRSSTRQDESDWSVRTATVLLLGAMPLVTFTLIYNQAVTGNAMRMPYQVYEQTRSSAPVFHWQQPRDVDLPDVELIRRHDQRHLDFTEAQRHWQGWLRHKSIAIGQLGRLLSDRWNPLALFCFIAAVLLQTSRCRIPIVVIATGLIANGIVFHSYPHYFAPILPSTLWIAAIGWKRIERVLANRISFSVTRWTAVAALAIYFGIRMFSTDTGGLADRWGVGFPEERATAIEQLESEPGRDLVLVRYDEKQPIIHEWVYNHASLQDATIVWARDFGTARNTDLLQSYPGRVVWSLVIRNSAATWKRVGVDQSSTGIAIDPAD